MKILWTCGLALFLMSFTDPIPYWIEFYKKLHAHPEISLNEQKTSSLLAEELNKIGFEVTTNFGGYGIVGIYKNGDGPLILYRTDMDALPMVEKTDLSYTSSEPNAMHSCGHDMHMTTWLGTAQEMVKNKSLWKGTLMLVGQPAEEIGLGSRMMLEAGLYEKFGVPDFGIGLHCNPTLQAGKVGVGDGFTMANVESIDILVKGIGAHGASPHMAVDPVVLASLMIMEFQTIVSRNINPIDNAVITVGSIHGGTVHNIIPDEVKLQLTVRTFKEDVRKLIHKRIKEIAKGIAVSAGLGEDLMPIVNIPENYTPSNFNYPEMTDAFRKSAQKVVGKDNVVETSPQLVGEDFSRYGQTTHKVPTVLFWLGTVSEEKINKGFLPGLHSPFYYPEPEKSLTTGIAVTSQFLLDLFNQSN